MVVMATTAGMAVRRVGSEMAVRVESGSLTLQVARAVPAARADCSSVMAATAVPVVVRPTSPGLVVPEAMAEPRACWGGGVPAMVVPAVPVASPGLAAMVEGVAAPG